MENILASLQRIMKNKNIVTIVGVILILVLLYWGYSSQIKAAVEPIMVPVATQDIQPRTEITDDMVEVVSMPSISIDQDEIWMTKRQVVGKYTTINAVVPKSSMFYRKAVVEQSKLPDSVFIKVKKGEIVYNFGVDMESTYGNSIAPGNKIDIYMKAGNGNDEKVMLGKLVENVEVLAVKDASGRDVFENSSENRTPSMLIFGVPEKINILLRKASYMSNLGVELFPVPHGGAVATEGTTEVSTQQLADYIEAHAVDIPLPETTEVDELLPTFTQSGNNVTIKFKKGCKTGKYTCSYTKDDGTAVAVKNTSVTVKFTTSGKISATVLDENEEAHTASQDVTIETPTQDTTQSAIPSTQGQ